MLWMFRTATERGRNGRHGSAITPAASRCTLHGAETASMVMRTVAGGCTGEDVEDLRAWLRALDGGPHVDEVVVLGCGAHEDDRPTWAYVEADARTGLARRRCLQCGTAVALLDSAERWSHPPMHACGGCGASILEVAAGLSLPDGDRVEWVVVGARCVGCGRLAGLTDMLLPPTPVAEVLERL